MGEPLGAYLVRKGLLTPAQLEEALQSQLIFGGSLGTQLIELRLLELATLGQALSDTFHFPLTREEELTRVSPETLALLRPELARNHQALPLALEGRRLRVAMVEPHEPRHLDALALATGMRIVPSILPEPRLWQALEKHYGLARPVRPARPGSPRPPGGHVPARGVRPADPLFRPPPAPGLAPPSGPRPVARAAPGAPPPAGMALTPPPRGPGPGSGKPSPTAARTPWPAPLMAVSGAEAATAPGPLQPPGMMRRGAPGKPPAPGAALAPGRSVSPGPAVAAGVPTFPAPSRAGAPPSGLIPTAETTPSACGAEPAQGPSTPPAPGSDPFAAAPPRTAELFPEGPATAPPESISASEEVHGEVPGEAFGEVQGEARDAAPGPGSEPSPDESSALPIVTGWMVRGMDLPLAPVEPLEMSTDMDFIASDSGSASWAQRAIEVDFVSIEAADAQGMHLPSAHEFLPPWEPLPESEASASAAEDASRAFSQDLSWAQVPEIMDALRRATTRGQLGRALLSYAEGRFSRGFLLGETFGAIRVGLACGPGSDRPEVAALKVDLSTPSLLAQAASDGGPVVSSAPEGRTDEALFAALGESFSYLVAAPIRVRQRAVGFVVIDKGPAPFAAEELDELERLLAAASEAYGRLHESCF